MFRASSGEGATCSTVYNFLSRVEAISGRVEQANNKFGHRNKVVRTNSWVQDQGLKHLQQSTLICDSATGDLRFHASWQAVLAIFELSATAAVRGRLERRIRSWTRPSDQVHEQRQAFTVSK